jgi:diaminopimelate decarboxylase
MDHFQYINTQLFAEDVAISTIAEEIGTPCFVYSRSTLERHWHAFNRAFGDYPHQICYAVKANGNLAILDLLARLGSGFDIVSGGELKRVIAAGGDPAKTVFSGVCKQDWEIRLALEAGIGCFNIESDGELEQISRIAGELGLVANISVRINPDVDAKTHPYISTGLRSNKFGLQPDKALETYRNAHQDSNIHVHGVACHIGSQLTDLSPYQDALSRMLEFVDTLEADGIMVEQIDFGGGLGVRYSDEAPPSPDQYWEALFEILQNRDRQIPVAIEPGRAIVANAGVLVTTVHSLKHNEDSSFCIVDAGMNDLIRPALYQAYQEIISVDQNSTDGRRVYDVVGPVCESGDFLGKDRLLQVKAGDLLVVRTSGAYASVMSSNYNGRARPAEVMVDQSTYHIIRERESLESLYAAEKILP